MLQLPTAACAQPTNESVVQSYMMTVLESMMHPQRSLRVSPLTYADVWAALPATREHRERNTARRVDEGSGTASYVVFESSEPTLDIDRVNAEPNAEDELDSVLFRLIRVRGDQDLDAANLLRRFDPTSLVGVHYCTNEVSNIARSISIDAVGWRCTKLGDELQVDVFPSCAAVNASQQCMVVQISASWPERNRP